MTLLPLPPRSPELDPVENIWQFIRDNWLSNQVFKPYEDILEQAHRSTMNIHIHRTPRMSPDVLEHLVIRRVPPALSA